MYRQNDESLEIVILLPKEMNSIFIILFIRYIYFYFYRLTLNQLIEKLLLFSISILFYIAARIAVHPNVECRVFHFVC